MIDLVLNNTDRVTEKVTDRVTDNLSEKQKKIISLLRENNKMTLFELSKALGISKRRVIDHTNKLKEGGD